MPDLHNIESFWTDPFPLDTDFVSAGVLPVQEKEFAQFPLERPCYFEITSRLDFVITNAELADDSM